MSNFNLLNWLFLYSIFLSIPSIKSKNVLSFKWFWETIFLEFNSQVLGMRLSQNPLRSHCPQSQGLISSCHINYYVYSCTRYNVLQLGVQRRVAARCLRPWKTAATLPTTARDVLLTFQTPPASWSLVSSSPPAGSCTTAVIPGLSWTLRSQCRTVRTVNGPHCCLIVLVCTVIS